MKSRSIWLSFGVVMLSLVGAILCCVLYAWFVTRDRGPKTLYCWLVFGSAAEPRILVECNGMAISLDANGNGRFEPDERFAHIGDCKNLAVISPGGETVYTITNVQYQRVNTPPWARLRFDVQIRGLCHYGQVGEAEMALTQRDAAEIPFDGPLVIRSPFAEYFRASSEPLTAQRLSRSGQKDQPNVLQVDVGTFNARSGAAVRSHVGSESAFPSGVHPVVDIRFPPNNKPGDPPVRRRYTLDGFC